MPDKKKISDFAKPSLHKQLGNLLVEAGLINEQQLNDALSVQKKTNERIGSILLNLHHIREKTLLNFLSAQLHIPLIDENTFKNTSQEVINLIPIRLAKKYNIIAVAKGNGDLKVAMSDPLNAEAIDDITRLTRLEISPILGDKKRITDAIEVFYRKYEEGSEIESIVHDLAEVRVELEKDQDYSEYADLNQLKIDAGDPPVVKLVNFLIAQAINDNASDIHIEAGESGVIMRNRIDGVLYKMLEVPRKMQMPIISRVKILADLDISERRIPQDGSFSIRFNGSDYDIRISTLPTLYGEKIVMRLLEKDAVISSFNLETLGFNEQQLAVYKKYMYRSHGMILITGPTGSGKTTTLYCALQMLNSQKNNIITVEDPIEYRLKGVQQVHVRADIGLDFASVLRSVLRQDPDILLVGEIRDQETAVMAIRASMTGHLVLSTLHTNDAVGTVLRLIDLGIDPFLVTSNVNIAVAQRLVRVICPFCKVEYVPTKKDQEKMGTLWKELDGNFDTLYTGKGCAACRHSGYQGRIGIYEVVEFDPELKDKILKGAAHYEIKSCTIAKGMKTIRQSGIEKIIKGITTPEEVLAACIDAEK